MNATLAVLREEIETSYAAIHVDPLVNVAQAVVRRNQKCLDAYGNHFLPIIVIAEVKRDLYSSFVIGIYWVLQFQFSFFLSWNVYIYFLAPSVFFSEN